MIKIIGNILLFLKILLKVAFKYLSEIFKQQTKKPVLETVMKEKEKTIFVFITTHLFDGLKQRPHHIALNIANRFQVFYFCPIFMKDWEQQKVTSPISMKKIDRNLTVYEIALFGGENISFFRSINRLIMELAIKSETGKNNASVLWLYDPRFEDLSSKFPNAKIVYDIMDEHTGFAWSPKDITERESKLLKKADVVFAGTKALYDSKKKGVKNIHFYSCGVDFKHFNEIPTMPFEIEKETSNWKGKILGYFGTVDMRIDQDLIEFIAKRHPEFTIVLLGPVIGDFSRFQDYDNIVLTGTIVYEKLSYYMSKFDVSIIPFVLNELTLHINPTKILEYFAGCKPVVSIAIPDVIEFYGDTVFISKDKEEFEKNLILALDTSKTKERIIVELEKAKAYSWESVVNSMLSKVI